MKVIDVIKKDHLLDPTDAYDVIRYCIENEDYVIDFDGIKVVSNTMVHMIKTALHDKDVEIVNLQ